MSEIEKSLNHFCTFRFTDDYWRLSSEERAAIHGDWGGQLRGTDAVMHCYQLAPMETSADLMVWSAVAVTSEAAPAHFFEVLAKATSRFRQYLESKTTLWGFTRPSQYSKSRSRQQIEPFQTARAPYLIIYPFTKTSDWYLMNQEARQGMMNEHIRIGKQYASIKQLLLYSFGLQDQEFVVVYETDDLSLFSTLVQDLRSTEARRFTLSDVPVHTGIYRQPEDPLSLWL